MSRHFLFLLFFLSVFLQSTSYGLTFLLPDLFSVFGANEKDVGRMLLVTALVTVVAIYYSGHLTDYFGRMMILSLSGFAIAAALFLYSITETIGLAIYSASGLMGLGWGLFYTLAPIVLTRLCSNDSRVQMFSLYAVFLMVGFGLSPVFAFWLGALGIELRIAFRVVAVFCAISGVVFLMLPKAIEQHAISVAPGDNSRLSPQAIKRIFLSVAWLPIVMICLGASVFAGVNNFQTVIAASEGVNYADYFLIFTVTTVICRVAFAKFNGGNAPYRVIGILHSIKSASLLLFLAIDGSQIIYIGCAILFAIGHGASFPIIVAMAANDAEEDLIPQTLQLFSLVNFIAIFGFPLIAGWLIVDFSVSTLLTLVAIIASIEACLAFGRHHSNTLLRD